MSRLIVLLTLTFFIAALNAKVGYGPGEQDWGYVDVRKGAHMFYWLYYTTANVKSYTKQPLAIWLQGGPGASSTGYGNFEEVGPLDLYGNYRNHTWVKDMNVLFIDNPVGTGFSYVDNALTQLTKTNNKIALDLVEFMKGFYKLHPEFEIVPLHIFCESYGGKMAPEFALELYLAIKRGELKSNFKSVNLGDPWTSPIDSVLEWAPLLWHMGIVDEAGRDNIMTAANKTKKLVHKGKWYQAFLQWRDTQILVAKESNGVDFYNIMKPTNGEVETKLLSRSNFDLMYRTLVEFDIDEDRGDLLSELMRGPVSKALNISSNVKWGSQSDQTFTLLNVDFMKPVIHIVERLLDETDLQVSVYSGDLDLICATAGTVNWINKMNWSYKADYVASKRVAIIVDRILEGYQKSAGNFTMLWINRAGHMVPADNPAAMDYILKKMTKYDANTFDLL